MRIALILLSLLLLGCQPDISGFEGSTIQMLIDNRIVCVPRRLLNPYDAKEFSALRNPDGTVRPVTPVRMQLTTFLPQLEGYTDSLYSEHARNKHDWSHNPEALDRLVGIQLINNEVAAFKKGADEKQFEWYEIQKNVDQQGFTTGLAKAECSGKRAGAGATIAIELGPECALAQIKYGNPKAPSLRLVCNPAPPFKRCITANVQNEDGIQFLYSFDMDKLPIWFEVHNKVREMIKQMADDKSCTKS